MPPAAGAAADAVVRELEAARDGALARHVCHGGRRRGAHEHHAGLVSIIQGC